MEHKYIRHSELGFVLWPRNDDVWHSEIAAVAIRGLDGVILSAGFCTFKNGRARVWGASVSLGIASKVEDAALLDAQMGWST